ncbi:MAG: DUF2442 domain-containing protein [Elstera sp.]
MHWSVVEVQAAGPRVLKVRFSDGLTGTIRIDPSYCTDAFSPLTDDTLLSQASIAFGAIVWPNGLDLAPDTMYRAIKNNPARHYDVGQPIP